MPRSILENKGFDGEKINCVANIQLLDSGTNRGLKNAKPFKEWINKYVADKEAYIKRHLIPKDENVWTEDSFGEFIQKRSTLMVGKIQEYF
jgi:hypothetical protein